MELNEEQWHYTIVTWDGKLHSFGIHRKGGNGCTRFPDLIASVCADEKYAALITASPDLLSAAIEGRQACQILANECRDQDDEQDAEIWQKKADKCATAIKKATDIVPADIGTPEKPYQSYVFHQFSVYDIREAMEDAEPGDWPVLEAAPDDEIDDVLRRCWEAGRIFWYDGGTVDLEAFTALYEDMKGSNKR